MLARSGGFARCGHCHEVFDARHNTLDPHAGAGHDGDHTGVPASESERDSAPHPLNDATPEAQAEAIASETTASSDVAPSEPPLTHEPPLSAEVPPFAAPVFAPGAEQQPRYEHVPETEHVPEAEHLPEAEHPPASESRDTPQIPAESPEPPLRAGAFPEAHRASEDQARPPEPIEPGAAARDQVLPSQTWSRSPEPSWDDDEPHINGTLQPGIDDEPHFSAPSPASPDLPGRTRAEPEFAVPTRSPHADEAQTEPHLEPHLREGVQARAERQAEGAPQRSAAADDPRLRAAGAPPVFAEPPPSSAHEHHFAVTREARTGTPRRALAYIVGGIVALALVVALVAQLAWWRREAVMVYWPDSQPLFAQVCAKLGCQLTPPRDIDGLQVEASDLRQIDGPHRLELRVPLRNRYGIALGYPAIELTLFDSKNDVAVRRILWPEDYVAPGTRVAAGLPAHTTQTMIVRLDSGNVIATNFRVQIFYP